MKKEWRRILPALACVFVMAFGLTGCPEISDDDNNNTSAVAVTGITLDKATATVLKGATVTLTATVAPENAADKTVVWLSADTAIATVSNGVVTGVKAGTVTVTAKAGSFTAACDVTVGEPLEGEFLFSDYKWKSNNATVFIDNDGVLHVTPSASGIAIQIADSELAALYEKYPAGFAVTAKVKPTVLGSLAGNAFASNGGKNFGVVSNVTDAGFYGAFIHWSGRMQLGTYQTAKGLQFGSLLTDNSGTIFKKPIDEPYVIRLENNSDVISTTVNGIVSDRSGTTTYTVPDAAKVARSATAGSYGILTEHGDSFALYSFKIEALDTGKAAIKMVTTEASGAIATLKENATPYVFLNDCAYSARVGSDATRFTVTAFDNSGAAATVTVENSNNAAATAVYADGVITVTPVAEGTTVITVKNDTDASNVRKITVTVLPPGNYVDTDYESPAALYPEPDATGVYEDDHLTITFDEVPELKEGNIEIYDDATDACVAAISVSGAVANTISDGSNEQLYSLKYFMVQISGNTVEIIPTCGALENGKTYYVAITDGVITGKINGKEFTGFDTAAKRWKFTTRAAHTPANPAQISVAKTGSTADFRTVQGAFKAVSADATITVEPGVYHEILYYTKNYNITLAGNTTTEFGKDVVICGINCNEYNGSSDTRTMFAWKGAADLTLKNITLQNAMDRNTMITGTSSQSEALYFNALGNKLAAYNSSFLGHQDTLLTKGKNWFYKCYIEGDTDFIWGYADVALFEECTLVQLDTSADKNKTSGSYIFETRVSSDDVSTAAVPKGYVLFNCKVTANHPNSNFARRASASKAAGNNYYDQVAIINTEFTGSGTINQWGYNGSSGNEPVYIAKDAANNMHVGWKTYGGSGFTPVTDQAYCGTITDEVYNAEYDGRAVILNRVYKKSGKYVNADSIWDYSALETAFGATADTSEFDSSAVTVDGANGTYDIRFLAEKATTAAAGSEVAFSQGYALTDGATDDRYVSWKGLKWHSSDYGVAAAGADAGITVNVAGPSVVTWTGSAYSNGTVTVTDGTVTLVDAASTKCAADKTPQGFLYTGSSAATLTLSFTGTTYINNLVVKVLDDEVNAVSAITITGSAKVIKDATATLTAAVTRTYLSISDKVSWKSSDTSVATVDANGVVTALAEGTATITATSVATPGVSGTHEITVIADAASPVYGQTYTYDFLAAASAAYESADTFVKASALEVNSSHGLHFKNTTNTMSVKVAGNVRIDLVCCQYGNGATLTVTDADSPVETGITQMLVTADKTVQSFTFTGNATTLSFTFDGETYIHGLTVTPVIAEKVYDFATDEFAALEGTSADSFVSWTATTAKNHGLQFKSGNVLKVAVPGNSTLSLVCCMYGNAGTATVTDAAGTTVAADVLFSNKTGDGGDNTCTTAQTVSYTGDPTVLTFTFANTAYIHKLTVTPAE